MYNTNITQKLPPFLCDLKNLTHVDFQLNYLPGEFPKSLYNCSKLEYLDLSQNLFVGEIPEDIHHLAGLRFLNLGGNNFSGDIPASIGNLKELRNLQLHQCLFNGTFPAEIGNLSNLELLYLFSNHMLPPSKFPSSLTQLNKLKSFDMHGSNLVGEIPETIGNMVALEVLDLSQNGLSGEIPKGLFMLKNLSVLYIYKNSLSGDMPGVVEAFNLTEIDLSDNNLSGKIPDDLGKLSKLIFLSLATNQLSGKVPESIGRLPALIEFLVFVNNLSGTLPPDFGRISKLETFQVASNSFTGSLPQNLCYHGRLDGLTAYDNNLSGVLPESLGSCNSLRYLRIENNELSGNIPSGLWTSLSLSTIKINENKFTGQLPERLAENLSDIGISYNQFSGRIPHGVSSSWKNIVSFNASNNLFNGSIPPELTSLPQLTTLLLDHNQFTGPLPSDIISWKSLINLNLSHNQLSGEIPLAIAQLPALNILDLSENRISGQIPHQLALTRLTNMNLSSNNLVGRIPSEFENLVYASSFLNNPGLCADTAVLNLILCNSRPQRVGIDRRSETHVIILSLVVAASFLALLSLFLMIRVYRKRKQELKRSWKLTSFQRLSFTKGNIVSSMSEHNIIGCGGYGAVYRVAVGDSNYVAVKKIRSNRKLEEKLVSSFLAEVEILSNIRHNNIVKLLCCVSKEDSLLLVYEYLENLSLDRWLHNKSKQTAPGSVLDWPKRLHIAIGAAQGLCYMHHDCLPPVVHRDVKTSNILLDSKFNAKVADFGLAMMLMKPEELATMSAVAGTFGYIAPEYAQTTRVNEKIDVYSFGVVLLELTTGKEANHGDEYSSLAEWAWRHIQVGTDVEDILDKEIKEACYMDEICNIFKLGVMCTATLPASRPSMKEVLKILLTCNSPLSIGDKNVGFYDSAPLLKNSKWENQVEYYTDDD